ncbi:MAG: TIGR03643 family protein [Litorimonas sp.]
MTQDHASKNTLVDNHVARTFPDDFVPATPRPDPGAVTASEIVAMAWDDDTSFDAIEAQTGLAEADVIKLMRAEMTPSSFRMWRKRVSGRSSKHAERG